MIQKYLVFLLWWSAASAFLVGRSTLQTAFAPSPINTSDKAMFERNSKINSYFITRSKTKLFYQHGRDFHAILGVDRGANMHDIKNAYRKLAKLYHPDAHPGRDTVDKFQEIQFAYENLIRFHNLRSQQVCEGGGYKATNHGDQNESSPKWKGVPEFEHYDMYNIEESYDPQYSPPNRAGERGGFRRAEKHFRYGPVTPIPPEKTSVGCVKGGFRPHKKEFVWREYDNEPVVHDDTIGSENKSYHSTSYDAHGIAREEVQSHPSDRIPLRGPNDFGRFYGKRADGSSSYTPYHSPGDRSIPENERQVRDDTFTRYRELMHTEAHEEQAPMCKESKEKQDDVADARPGDLDAAAAPGPSPRKELFTESPDIDEIFPNDFVDQKQTICDAEECWRRSQNLEHELERLRRETIASVEALSYQLEQEKMIRLNELKQAEAKLDDLKVENRARVRVAEVAYRRDVEQIHKWNTSLLSEKEHEIYRLHQSLDSAFQMVDEKNSEIAVLQKANKELQDQIDRLFGGYQ